MTTTAETPKKKRTRKPSAKKAIATGVPTQESTPVKKIPPQKELFVNKAPRRPGKKILASSRIAFNMGSTNGIGNIVDASFGSGYSPELSTDFLELPQSLAEKWGYYRFFYKNHPFVAQALDLHTELPLSKVRFDIPEAKNREIALAATKFCRTWAKKINLLQRYISIVHERHLIGSAYIYVVDNNPDIPEDLLYDVKYSVKTTSEGVPVFDFDGNPVMVEEKKPKENTEEAVAWMKKNYKGWTSIRCLRPEQVRVESFDHTDEKLIEWVPDDKTKRLLSMDQSDPRIKKIIESIPLEIRNACQTGKKAFLGSDPDAGSFLYCMENKKSDYEDRGESMLGRCLKALVHQDKLRQANASIASRHMTPHRLVWAEDLDIADLEALREQVDASLQDPDFSVVTNYEVHWEEMGADQRLLDLTSEMEMTNREIYAGLGVTEGLLTGEGSYSGDRINLEVINTRYTLLREQMQDFTEEFLLKPMCRRMGFIEEDEDGNEVVIYPKLSFTRLSLRDNRDTFDILFNLYQKGSVDIDIILELLNIDPVSTREKILRDALTVNDSAFNEVLRGLYGEAGRVLGDPEKSDAIKKIAEHLGIKLIPPKPEGRY